MNGRYEISKQILNIFGIIGCILIPIGIILSVKGYYDVGFLGLYSGVVFAIYGIIMFVSSQIALAQIEVASNTYNILMKISNGSVSKNSNYTFPKTVGKLKVGDRVKVFKGYEILKAENGCTIGENTFDNILDAERWVYRNPK